MSYRSKSDSLRSWKLFRDRHRNLIGASGLPEAYIDEQATFIDFLMHGYIDHHIDTRQFPVEDMSPAEHQAFESLVREYFRDGFGYVQPMAFRSKKLVQDFEEEFASNR